MKLEAIAKKGSAKYNQLVDFNRRTEDEHNRFLRTISQGVAFPVALNAIVQNEPILQDSSSIDINGFLSGHGACLASETYHALVLKHKGDENYQNGYVVFVDGVPIGHIKRLQVPTFVPWQTMEDSAKGGKYKLVLGGLYLLDEGLKKIVKKEKFDKEKMTWGRLDINHLVLSPTRFLGAREDQYEPIHKDIDYLAGDEFRDAIRHQREQIKGEDVQFQNHIIVTHSLKSGRYSVDYPAQDGLFMDQIGSKLVEVPYALKSILR